MTDRARELARYLAGIERKLFQLYGSTYQAALNITQL